MLGFCRVICIPNFMMVNFHKIVCGDKFSSVRRTISYNMSFGVALKSALFDIHAYFMQ